jgi:ribosomal protein S18 acetylase RimI-like enzyme
VIRFRPFLNTDSPAIVDIWRQQPPFRGFFHALTRDLLDQHVFGKPYFDRLGLIIAFDDEGGTETSLVGSEKPLGFVHAGFGPNESLSDTDSSTGIISQLKMIPGDRASEIGRGLLDAATHYLQQRGAKIMHVGSDFPHTPFYLGLYGGSRVPGVMDEDGVARDVLEDYGFVTHDRILAMERSLTGFRTLMDRQQIGLRRQFQIKSVVDPLEASWWGSCTMGLAERDRFSVFNKAKREYCGSVSFWDMQPLSLESPAMSRGLYDLRIDPGQRRGGMATYLVGEAMRQLAQNGVGRIEVQVRDSDTASLGVFRKLGFETVTQGYLMSKPISV